MVARESVCVVALAAGKGVRMQSSLPKVLHPIAGRPLILHALSAIRTLDPVGEIVVIGPGNEAVSKVVAPALTVCQQERLGTAHAVLACRNFLEQNQASSVFVLFGDTPFISPDTLMRMQQARGQGVAVVVLGFRAKDPTGYGRLVLDDNQDLGAIIEHKEASEDVRRIDLCNAGVMAFDAQHLLPLLDRIENNNKTREYHLTEVIALARRDGLSCRVVEADENEVLGVNNRLELSAAERIWQNNKRREMMEQGVSLADPETVWFSWDTVIENDVSIGPNVVFGPGVQIQSEAIIHAFCHLEECHIGPGCSVGPFARIRPGTLLEEKTRIGNFVEVKNSHIAAQAKINHLSYVGDAMVGESANIGAGVITCNYDGINKNRTRIDAHAFIGSNTSLVAPVHIARGAIVGAGSTITEDVGCDDITLTRSPQKILKGKAKIFRQNRAKSSDE